MTITKDEQIPASLTSLRFIARTFYRCRGTGLPRLGEWIRFRMALRAASHPERANVWVKDFCDRSRFCCDLSEHMGNQIFFRGSYSGTQLKFLRQLLKDDSVFVDAGANQGEFTVCAAALVPRGKVHAFEPVPDIRRRLERNVQANEFKNVQVHPVGLSNENRDDVSIFGRQSVFGDGTQHNGLPTLFDLDGRRDALARIALRRLDEVLSSDARVDVIKIDVEGAEWFVLQGAEEIIRRERPAIIFEANEETCEAAGYTLDDIHAWLKARGYQLQQIGDDAELYPFETSQRFCNVLAMPSSIVNRQEIAA